MDRSNKFNKYKIYQASTNKVGLNVYMDSFGIEKVRLQAQLYDKSLPKDKRSVSCYMNFEEFGVLKADCDSGRIFKKIQDAGDYGYILSRGGTTKSKVYENGIESRIITLKLKNDKLFMNLSRGQGKKSSTGAIMPDGKPDLVIGVPLDPAVFRALLIESCLNIQAYRSMLIPKLVAEAQAERENGTMNSDLEDAPSEGTIITETDDTDEF